MRPGVGVYASAVVAGACTDVVSEPFNTLAAWTGTGALTPGRTLTGAQVTTTGALAYTIPALNESDTVTVGFAFRATLITATNRGVIEFASDANATSHTRVTHNGADGRVSFWRGVTELQISAAGLIVPNTWHYLEVQTRLHDSTGTGIVRVDGVEAINLSGIDTKNAGTKTVYDTIRLVASTSNTNLFDDLYLSTGSGCAFKGDQVVGSAVGFKGSLGTQVATASGSTLVITTTGTIDVGDLVVVRVAADNLNATTPTFTCADSGSNTYTTHAQTARNATGAAGIAGAIMVTKATTGVAIGGTITVTLSGSVAARAAYAESFTGFNNTTRSTPVSANGASAAATVTSGTVNSGDLVVGAVALESRVAVTGDADSLNGSWSTIVNLPNVTSGTDNLRVQTSGQYKIATGSGAQTFDHTVTNTDWASLIAVLQAT